MIIIMTRNPVIAPTDAPSITVMLKRAMYRGCEVDIVEAMWGMFDISFMPVVFTSCLADPVATECR